MISKTNRQYVLYAAGSAPAIAISLALAGCGGDGGPGNVPTGPTATVGSIEITVATTGVDVDFDGYVATDGTREKQLNRDGAAELGGQNPGTRQVLLQDVAGNCEVDGTNPRDVVVSAGAVSKVRFDISCSEIPPLVDKIVFESCFGFVGLELFSMNLDGSEVTQLTFDRIGGGAGTPDVSPDGKRIAFATFDDRIMIMNADLGDTWEMPTNGGTIPNWSPDGTRIVYFEVDPAGPTFEIKVQEWETGRVQTLTEGGRDLLPKWSPDGSRILFLSRRNSPGGPTSWGDLYTMNADGSNVVRLTFTDLENGLAHWSPDGTKISFKSLRDAADPTRPDIGGKIFVMNADGSDPVRLTDDVWPEAGGEWSPDGSRISHNSSRGKADTPAEDLDHDIWLTDPDGTNLVELGPIGCQSGGATWSPMSGNVQPSVSVDGG